MTTKLYPLKFMGGPFDGHVHVGEFPSDESAIIANAVNERMICKPRIGPSNADERSEDTSTDDRMLE